MASLHGSGKKHPRKLSPPTGFALGRRLAIAGAPTPSTTLLMRAGSGVYAIGRHLMCAGKRDFSTN